jgi:hypothetical protein
MRRSNRRVPEAPLSKRLTALFHSEHVSQLSPKFVRIHSNPNVYLIKDFLSDADINYFDKVCTIHTKKFRASFTEGENHETLISNERTSKYIHLSKGQDSHVRSIERRASDLMGLQTCNVEPLQIVSYTKGQKFDLHHDGGTLLDDGSVELVLPKRLITFFTYLNTLPSGIGCTSFPSLGLSVTPERGTAVLFCNVLPDGTPDARTIHKAEPVFGKLEKFGVNIWLCEGDMQDLSLEKPRNAIGAEAKVDLSAASSVLLRAEAVTARYCYKQARRARKLHKRRTAAVAAAEAAMTVTSDGSCCNDAGEYWSSTSSSVQDSAAAADESESSDVSSDSDSGVESDRGRGSYSRGSSSQGHTKNKGILLQNGNTTGEAHLITCSGDVAANENNKKRTYTSLKKESASFVPKKPLKTSQYVLKKKKNETSTPSIQEK